MVPLSRTIIYGIGPTLSSTPLLGSTSINRVAMKCSIAELKSEVTNKAATFLLVSAVVISSNPNPRHVLLDGRGRT